VTALPQNSKVQLGALALAPDHTQLQQMTKVRLASLKAGMSSRLTEQVLALLKTQPAAVDEGEYNIKVESSSSLSFMFKAKFAGKGGSTDTTYDDKASLHLVVQGRHSQEVSWRCAIAC
jgi:ABC-type transport system involved in cytochrome c biogenesis ATPase subunit